MDITYLGAGSVRLAARGLSIVCDPAAGTKVTGEVVTISSPDVKAATAGAKMVLETPGEFEIAGSLVVGIPTRLHVDEAGERGTAYTVTIEGVRVAVLGNIAPELTGEQLEAIGEVHVLVIPVGGHGLTLDAEAAAALVGQLEPRYVIPVHYDDGVTVYPIPQDKLDTFLSAVGMHSEPVAKLKVTEKDLPAETTVVVLEPQMG